MIAKTMFPSSLIFAFLGGVLGCVMETSDGHVAADISHEIGSLDGPLQVTAKEYRYFVRGAAPTIFAGPGGPEDLLFHGARLANGTRSGGDQGTLIDALAAGGGDALYVHAVKSHGGDGIGANGTYPACRQGSACYWYANPFRYGNPQNPADPRVLDQWYSWLSRADAAGVVSHFFLYDDSSCPWHGAVTAGRIRDRTACRSQTGLIPEENVRLITPVVNRFKSLKNIVWVVAEEYSEAITTSRASAIAARIRALDPTHAIAVHQLSGTTFKFANDPNVKVFHMQLGAGVNTQELLHASVVQAYNAAAGRYAVVLAESAWQRALMKAGDRTSVRQGNWAAVMGGAAGTLVDGMWEPIAPDSLMLGDLRRLKTFIEGTAWAGMINGDAYVSEAADYARYGPAGEFIMYSDACDEGALLGYGNVIIEGDYTVEWFDAVDGSTSTAVQHLTPGANTFTVPADIAGECGVWVH